MQPFWSNGVATLYNADARAIPLPDGSVHCVVTSPPYWGLRDYGLSAWKGGDPECGHTVRNPNTPRQTISGPKHQDDSVQKFAGECRRCGATQQAAGIGLEPTLSDWLANIVAVSREVWRVLRDDGTYWLNLGDSYSSSGKGHSASGFHNGDKQETNAGSVGVQPIARGKRIERGEGSGRWGMGDTAVDGLPAKNLMGQPWRAAFALQDDGWYLRSAIIWHKSNPMPESVSDRPTSAYEMVFLLTKRPHYFYDAEAVREPQSELTFERFKGGQYRSIGQKAESAQSRQVRSNASFKVGAKETVLPNGRNSRNVWSIPTQGRPEAHFATFPDELPRRCILAGTSEHGVCADCGAQWERIREKCSTGNQRKSSHVPNGGTKTSSTQWEPQTVATDNWQPTCQCNAARIPATVLDCFVGSGTTVAVAQQLGRHGIGLDLNPDYLAIAAKRLTGITLPMAI